MTLLRIALRSHLAGAAGVTLIGVLFGVANSVGFAQIAGPDAAQRALFARQMEVVGRQLTYLLPIPVEIDTLAGYLQWRMFGTLAQIYAFWAVIAGSGAGRGDEERGLVETWLAAGVTRRGYLAVRCVGFIVVAAASTAAVLGLTWLGSLVAGETLAAAALLLQGLDLIVLASLCFAVSLLVAQLTTTRRGAGGIAGIVMIALFLVNSASRSGGLEQVAWLSPFWLYDRSTPLLRAGTVDGGALAALAVAAVAAFALAVLAFGARDLDAPLLRTVPRAGRPSRRPSRDPLLRLPVLAMLDQQRSWIIGWAIGLAALAAFLTSLTRTMVDSMLSIPTMRVYFERLGPTGYDGFVGVIWGSTALLLLSLFAIFQVNGWVSDDAEGRLASALAQPISRARVVLERLGSLLLGASIIAAAGATLVWITAGRAGIALSGDRFATGSALMVGVPFAFGAIGAALASWRPRLAVPVLTLVAVLSYFTQQFVPLLDWPGWVERTSIYALYGQPIARGADWGGIAALLAIGTLGSALALVLFQRRDVGT